MGSNPIGRSKYSRKLRALAPHAVLFQGGAMVAQPAVNRKVVGSSPTPGAMLPSSRGRTSGFQPEGAGSNPAGRSNSNSLAAPRKRRAQCLMPGWCNGSTAAS